MTTTEMRKQDELTDDELDRVTGGLDPLVRRQIATAIPERTGSNSCRRRAQSAHANGSKCRDWLCLVIKPHKRLHRLARLGPAGLGPQSYRLRPLAS